MLRGIAVEVTKALDGHKIYTIHWLLPIDDEHWHDCQEVLCSKKELVTKLKELNLQKYLLSLEDL